MPLQLMLKPCRFYFIKMTSFLSITLKVASAYTRELLIWKHCHATFTTLITLSLERSSSQNSGGCTKPGCVRSNFHVNSRSFTNSKKCGVSHCKSRMFLGTKSFEHLFASLLLAISVLCTLSKSPVAFCHVP